MSPRFASRPLTSLFFVAVAALRAANEPILVEAEAGTAGAGWLTATNGAVTYLTPAATGGGGNPGAAARVAGYVVTFPTAGTYELYARLRVGPSGAVDDSFFYAAAFGSGSPTSDADWIVVNNLLSVGHTDANATVTGGGAGGSGVWKWVKLSAFNGGEAPVAFTVPAGALTQTFQIGAREDGLWIDRLAFGRQNVTYTVSNLDSGSSGTVTFVPSGPPLATDRFKFLGTVHSSTQAINLTAYWNQVTPENAGKWGSVEPVRDVMNWGQLDAAYQLAKTNRFPFRMHVLIWGSQQPAWIETLAAAEQLAEIEEWFAAVANRYPDIDYLEVVNEPLHAPPSGAGRGNYISALGGNGATGWDWVLNAFRLARLRFPDTPLVLNDYSVTNTTSSAQSYLGLIRLLQAEDLIDVVGVQGHAFETTVSAATTRANLDRIAAAGLPIMITELDIDGPTDEVQLADYQRIFPVFWEHPAVIGVTLWGHRPGMWRTDQGAPLVYANDVERPALVWLRGYVRNTPPGDADRDGFPDAYEWRWGASATSLAPAADADGDGVPALLEYALGLRPDSGDRTGLPVTGTVSVQGTTYLTLTHRRAKSAGQTTALTVQHSTDLLAWRTDQTTPVAVVPAPGETDVELVTVRSTSPLGVKPAEFIRVKAGPPAP